MAGLREPHKLIVTTVTVTSSGHSFNYYIITFLHFLYQATECQTKFVIDSECKSLQVEVNTFGQLLKVQSKAAVVPASDRNVLAVEHARIALASSLGHGLDKSEMLVVMEFLTNLITSQNSLIVLTGLHLAVATKECLQIHAQMRVRVPTLFFTIGCAFTISNCQRFVAVLQIVVQDFSYKARAVLYFRPCASFYNFFHFALGRQI